MSRRGRRRIESPDSGGIILRGLDLLLTYRCTSSCRICTYYSRPGPDNDFAELDVAAAVDAVRQVASHPLQWVMLFGGEPFLCYERLLAVAAEVSAAVSCRVSVFTNGYWAADTTQAARLLKPLAAAGVSQLNLSLDSFHASHVDPQCVLLAAKAAVDCGLEVIVDGRLPADPNDPAAEVTSRLLRGFAQATGIEPTSGPIRLTGRAAESITGPPEDLTYCELPPYLGADLAAPTGVEIHPGGEVCFCSGICIGNIHDRPLAEILSSYRVTDVPVLATLSHEGPAGLLRLAMDLGKLELLPHGGEMPRCQACHLARQALRGEFAKTLRPAWCYGAFETRTR